MDDLPPWLFPFWDYKGNRHPSDGKRERDFYKKRKRTY